MHKLINSIHAFCKLFDILQLATSNSFYLLQDICVFYEKFKFFQTCLESLLMVKDISQKKKLYIFLICIIFFTISLIKQLKFILINENTCKLTNLIFSTIYNENKTSF